MSDKYSLRELRLYHWNKAMSARRSAKNHATMAVEWEKIRGKPCRYHRTQERRNNQIADRHLGFVQRLNDVPELQGTTAEQDASK